VQPGEALVVSVDAGTTLVFTQGCCGGNRRFDTTVVVSTSIPIEFRTSDRLEQRSEQEGGIHSTLKSVERLDWLAGA
jgi:hypothetical protein